MTNIIRPLGRVTEQLAEISEKSKPGIQHLHQMTEGTVRLLETLNRGLTPMQDISLGLVDLLETTNQTMQVATLAILVLVALLFLICFGLVAMCALYYVCYYKKETGEDVNSKQEVQDKI